jgi:acyl-CoA reductase-like NAD-dependent aldehyde dehydrogenase
MHRRLLVEGRWEEGASTQEVRAPWDGRGVAHVSLASAGQVERALAFAASRRRELGQASAGSRRAVLERVVARLEAEAPGLARLICEEAGKPIALARAEVARAAETFRLAAAELSRYGGSVVPVDLAAGTAGTEAEVRRFPAGVVVGIVPFNFPLNLGAHKLAPALAVGAPIIVKPPPQAPSAMLKLAELVLDAGAHPAAVQVLPCASELAERLATDARVRVMSFTGSARVGWHLKARVAGRAVLELGGNVAAIVCADGDVLRAARALALSGFAYAGQVCIKAQRLIVEDAAWDSFVGAFLAEVERLGCGDPSRDDVVVGPVIDASAAARIEEWIAEALAAGGTALLRGAIDGQVLTPTVLVDAPRHLRIVHEEVFGPVVVLQRVATFDAALEAANDSQFGLQASLFSNDLRRVRRAFHELEVGGVIVNDAPSFRSDNQPYGGVKGSGLGREGLRRAMEDYSEERVLVYRPG